MFCDAGSVGDVIGLHGERFMPRTATQLPSGIRITDKVTFGQFTKVFPIQVIRQALMDEGKESIRQRDLPNHMVVYFVMMLALFRDASHTEVLRCVYEGLQWLFGPSSIKITGKSGISQARTRVGWEPLKRLFEAVAVPLAKPGDKGAFFHGHRIVAIDGTLFDVADTPENEKTFGRPKNGTGVGSYPQARLVGLVECGTHAFVRAEIAGYCESEQAVAPKLLSHLNPHMVCLADRNFMSFDLFKLADQTKAKLVWRVRKDVKLLVEERLSDGSYLSTIYAHYDRKRSHGMKVRVVEYRVKNSNEPIRLLTNWYDHKEAPVQELAQLYHERWEYESTLDEVKTHLGANAVTLRSRMPDLVKQELLGLLMGHYAIRAVMHEAAQLAKIDDDELSFTHSVQVIRRRLPMFGNFSPGADSQSNHCRDLATAGVV